MTATITDPRPRQALVRPAPHAPRRRAAFWLLAFVFAATMLGTTLPTPLYVLYQARWHFAAGVVTLIFAVYAAGVVAALLLAGRSSDQAGRKPVLAVALGLSALSTVVFLLAPDVGVLLAARIVSGLAVPMVGVGVASQFIGDFRSVLALSVLLAVLCVFALAGIARALASDPAANR